MNKRIGLLLLFLAVAGAIDAGYLTYEHFTNAIPPCSTSFVFADCGKVLTSPYALIFGIPLALIGFIHYIFESFVLLFAVIRSDRIAKRLSIILTTIGFVSSLYFVYLQLFVIGAICFYCMTSAVISVLLFIGTQIIFANERIFLIVQSNKLLYRYILKPLFFLHDPELMHEFMTSFGEMLGTFRFTRWILSSAFLYKNEVLHQTIAGIEFENPIGLAAGFDYEAKITQITPSISFGFQSIGTITNNPYEGNERPMLGRLPKSKSLMVNKGFKNLGAKKTARKLEDLRFSIPIGVSIGRTNTLSLKTQKESVSDIVSAFMVFERSNAQHAYYELNISCPNLKGTISFYPPRNLEELLKAVDKLKLSRPLFIKMPIEKSNKETLQMLEVIKKHAVMGVIFGNLQKDRTNPALHPDEVAKFSVGNFSGKPCFDRSNELIRLTWEKYQKRFIIIGCGGVFSAEDAYTKIKLGASLVQLITGMIYEGPQLIADINMRLPELLQRDGFHNISEAVGSEGKKPKNTPR